jgi:basic membrane lipoprotein Med (substrate-binding protein (PBP1-ABC) superfamily)
MNRKVACAICAAFALLVAACGGKPAPKAKSIAVFIPGVRAGNAIYDGLAKGVEQAVAEAPGTKVKIFEAGFNQAEWEEKLTSLVATGEYDLMVTSNPSMPELCVKVGKSFPKQKFICLDGFLKGNSQIHSTLYNQTEQGYVTGYLAGLVTMSSMKGANPDKKVGLVIGQHYPVMDTIIAPAFEQGLKAVDPAIQLDTRVVGNWFDAAKAADLSKSMIDAGADVILPICGSASQGVLKAAQDAGKYVVIFDGDDFARAPGTVLGCTVLHQAELAHARVKAAFEGKIAYGSADVVGMKDGYIEFLDKNPAYLSAVPDDLRSKMDGVLSDIRSGKVSFQVPEI